jgi:hypothetical protein
VTSASCTVRVNGEPLKDAMVTFVPEEFLGVELKRGEGKTDGSGTATITVPPPSDPPPDSYVPGMAMGFYRVEISKKENGVEIIPKQYNAATTLGAEVAPDRRRSGEGMVFDLKIEDVK